MNRKHAIIAVVVLSLLVIGLPLAAQSTTATIRGKVTNASGNGVGDAEVNAVSTTTGFVNTVKSGPDGSYVLGGLRPGVYNVIVAAPGSEPLSRELEVRVGQTVDLDFELSGTLVVSEAITVVGNQLADTKATEIGTNVTPQQIEALPQSDRNFLNFAELAPGITMSTDPANRTISAAGQPAAQTNVFIDGVSFKNDVQPGGIAGQNSSRGNPFPQNAVQEFRVLTQNYSAQYDHASTAVITAVTKSGTNKLDGGLFYFYQPRDWVEELPQNFRFGTVANNADYKRWQAGLDVGGPIIKDRLHFFFSAEVLDEHAVQTVAPGTPPAGAVNIPNLGQYAGTFSSPFRSNLAFGKLSWQASTSQQVDFSGSYRREKDLSGFGGRESLQSAEDKRNYVYNASARHQWTGGNTLNLASLTWQKYSWDPTARDLTTVGQNFFDIIRIGGRSTTQLWSQRRIELRDDYTMAGVQMQGQHTFQVGGNLDFMNYDVDKNLNANPVFNYRADEHWAIPFEALYGFGDSGYDASNSEFGIYGQDNWVVNDHLNLNLGVRWDYESHMLDTDFVTPASAVTALTGKISSDYFSTGDSRDPYKGAIQPRLGFSYDLFANSRSVIFGGAGRYYDRLFLSAGLDERFHVQYPTYRFQFSANGCDPAVTTCAPGQPLLWKESYLSRAALDQLIAQGTTRPELFLVSNDTKPPYSDQWNIGYRQALGPFIASASYNVVRGYRGFSWSWGGGSCCLSGGPDYGVTLISHSTKRYWYDGTYVTLERPYNSQSHWGAQVAWTHADATSTGSSDLFALDYPTPEDFPRHATEGSQQDRIVASGIFGLPLDVRMSLIATLGTGGAVPVHDFSRGFCPGCGIPYSTKTVYPPQKHGFAERNLDLRLEKAFPLAAGTSAAITAEVFNAFNNFQGGCLANFLPPEGNPNLGKSDCVVNLPRRFQLGVRVGF
ncbi:MAG: TonB-dependent receptor domain-containing protein [Thermoanaerobaculia bacterium]